MKINDRVSDFLVNRNTESSDFGNGGVLQKMGGWMKNKIVKGGVALVFALELGMNINAAYAHNSMPSTAQTVQQVNEVTKNGINKLKPNSEEGKKLIQDYYGKRNYTDLYNTLRNELNIMILKSRLPKIAAYQSKINKPVTGLTDKESYNIVKGVVDYMKKHGEDVKLKKDEYYNIGYFFEILNKNNLYAHVNNNGTVEINKSPVNILGKIDLQEKKYVIDPTTLTPLEKDNLMTLGSYLMRISGKDNSTNQNQLGVEDLEVSINIIAQSIENGTIKNIFSNTSENRAFLSSLNLNTPEEDSILSIAEYFRVNVIPVTNQMDKGEAFLSDALGGHNSSLQTTVKNGDINRNYLDSYLTMMLPEGDISHNEIYSNNGKEIPNIKQNEKIKLISSKGIENISNDSNNHNYGAKISLSNKVNDKLSHVFSTHYERYLLHQVLTVQKRFSKSIVMMSSEQAADVLYQINQKFGTDDKNLKEGITTLLKNDAFVTFNNNDVEIKQGYVQDTHETALLKQINYETPNYIVDLKNLKESNKTNYAVIALATTLTSLSTQDYSSKPKNLVDSYNIIANAIEHNPRVFEKISDILGFDFKMDAPEVLNTKTIGNLGNQFATGLINGINKKFVIFADKDLSKQIQEISMNQSLDKGEYLEVKKHLSYQHSNSSLTKNADKQKTKLDVTKL